VNGRVKLPILLFGTEAEKVAEKKKDKKGRRRGAAKFFNGAATGRSLE